MKVTRILVCDGSVDGIFTAIYKAYDMHYGHDHIKIVEKSDNLNIELFSEYIDIETDYELSLKVGNSIRKKISRDAYEFVVRSALSDVEGRSDAIYRFLILGFHMGKDILSCLNNDVVNQIFVMNRNVGNEVHHMLGFLRFEEVQDGLLLSVVKPKNNIVALMAPHFADRLNNENFMIYDERRHIAAIHQKNTEPIMMPLDEDVIDSLKRSKSQQEEYEKLWKAFYKSISIKERENFKLQRNNLPLRFRGNMTEFH